MRGEAVNIAGSEIVKRWAMMGMFLIVSSILLFILFHYSAPKLWRLSLFLPFLAAFLGFFQAQRKTCVILGMKGTQNLGNAEEPLKDSSQKSQLRSKSTRILIWSISLSALFTLLAYFL